MIGSVIEHGTVAVVGAEPAALACAATLLQHGIEVLHVFPSPIGIWGASREIGLAYPELGEPYERLADSLGCASASTLHAWGREGIELLTEDLEGCLTLRRGSRLCVTRSEQEATLIVSDALIRQSLGDEVRLMSGAAASNYAPLATEVHQASFETHALNFAPVTATETLLTRLSHHPRYRGVSLDATTAWLSCRVEASSGGAKVYWEAGGTEPEGIGQAIEADLVVVAASTESSQILGCLQSSLVPVLGQAFQSEPLRETTRSSVLGVTASWGYERYRFDAQWRLLACGINPVSSERCEENLVNAHDQEVLWSRAETIFSDLALSDPELAMKWGILFCMTCDGLPVLGPLPGEPHIHVATGFGVSAWSQGYGAGGTLARILLGEQASDLIWRCSPRRWL